MEGAKKGNSRLWGPFVIARKWQRKKHVELADVTNCVMQTPEMCRFTGGKKKQVDAAGSRQESQRRESCGIVRGDSVIQAHSPLGSCEKMRAVYLNEKFLKIVCAQGLKWNTENTVLNKTLTTICPHECTRPSFQEIYALSLVLNVTPCPLPYSIIWIYSHMDSLWSISSYLPSIWWGAGSMLLRMSEYSTWSTPLV